MLKSKQEVPKVVFFFCKTGEKSTRCINSRPSEFFIECMIAPILTCSKSVALQQCHLKGGIDC